MKVLVIGSGGREHALAWKLAQSSHVTELWVAPGNAGMEEERLASNGAPVRCARAVGADDLEAVLGFVLEHRPDLTVVGPDNPLAMGIVDRLEGKGFPAWGPTRQAAQFESSKVFSQEFMERHGIPTARAGTFSDAAAARAFAAELGGRCAVKADGLALGKGVLLCTSLAEAEKAVDEIMVQRAFGAAGGQVVIQELLEGVEISLHALCDGRRALLFPTSQDHKRALDGDQGLNTGGMGTYCPAPFLTDAEAAEVGRRILQPWLAGCAAEGLDFRGILYPGLMLTASGPKVLEFNVRFGDPETQVYLMRLENDLFELLMASRQGRLEGITLSWRPEAAVCVVMASGGYPGHYDKGKPIRGLTEAAKLPQTKVFHAGTRREGEQILTNGGRVLGVTALGADLRRARDAAYAAVERIEFDGAQFRRDIAAKALGLGRAGEA